MWYLNEERKMLQKALWAMKPDMMKISSDGKAAEPVRYTLTISACPKTTRSDLSTSAHPSW